MKIKIIDLLNKISNENEYWKQIEDYGTYNTYFISTQGRICNQKGKVLKQRLDKSGYPRVMLRDKNSKRKFVCIHRLVAEAFLDNFDNKPCIDHIDRNKLNNHYSNLRYVTPKENSNNENTIKHLKIIGKRYKTEYGKQIINKSGEMFQSIIEASRQTNIPRSNIQYHLKNKTGEWEYV